jgi:DNA-binding transcriptional LysR family regulator
MDIEWISDFLQLASSKNFTIASNERNISQPAFSRRIASLEQWVGASLIDRNVHPFSLTKEGQHFRVASQEFMNSLYRTIDECQQRNHIRQNFVRFTALHTVVINFFAEWMTDIHKNFGLVHSSVDSNNVYDCIEMLKSEQAEFMLSYSNSHVPYLLDPTEFMSKRLAADKLILVSGTDEKGKPLYDIDLENPKPTNYLAYTSGSLTKKITDSIIDNNCPDFPLVCVYENSVTESIKAMASKGMGIGWIPKICAKDELERKELVEIGGDNLSVDLDILIFRSNKRLSNDAESLWSYLNRS